jgi:hypothetical protein
MNVLVSLALAFPLGCLALLSIVALLGVLLLAGALRGVGAIGMRLRTTGTEMSPLRLPNSNSPITRL